MNGDATGILTGQSWLYPVAVLGVYTRRVAVSNAKWSTTSAFATFAQARSTIFHYIETFNNRPRSVYHCLAQREAPSLKKEAKQGKMHFTSR